MNYIAFNLYPMYETWTSFGWKHVSIRFSDIQTDNLLSTNYLQILWPVLFSTVIVMRTFYLFIYLFFFTKDSHNQRTTFYKWCVCAWFSCTLFRLWIYASSFFILVIILHVLCHVSTFATIKFTGSPTKALDHFSFFDKTDKRSQFDSITDTHFYRSSFSGAVIQWNSGEAE